MRLLKYFCNKLLDGGREFDNTCDVRYDVCFLSKGVKLEYIDGISFVGELMEFSFVIFLIRGHSSSFDAFFQIYCFEIVFSRWLNFIF